MDGIIEVKVNGYSISKDSSIAGTQYESKSTKLRITFAENWDGYAKTITFWNALGENAVVIQLGTNLLEDILVSDSVYIVPIAGEAMTEAGEFNFVIEGIDNGVVKRTVGDKLRVLPSPKASNADQAQDVTPTQAEQIRAEIDSVIEDIAEAKEAAVEAHEAVEEVRNMSVSCETLGVGETPTVEKSIEDDIVNLHFGIPTSEEGIHIGAEAPTEPFVKVWIDTDGEEDTEYVTREELEAHTIDFGNPHMVTPALIGLGNVDNTRDADKTVFCASESHYAEEAEWAYKAEMDYKDNVIHETYATKAELNENMGSLEATVLAQVEQTYATKEELDNMSVDMSDYYTKLETDEALLGQQSQIIAYTDLKYAWKTDIGDIESALDELHAYAQALIGGAE